MTKIYTAEEAEALALGHVPEPWTACVSDLAASVAHHARRADAAEAEAERLRRLWDRQSDRWLIVDGWACESETFDTRDEAEAEAIARMTDRMSPDGCAEDQIQIYALVSTTEEIRGEPPADEDEDEDDRPRSEYDYWITGYRCTSGGFYLCGTDEHPAAVRVRAELEAEIASLRARVAELEAEAEKPTLSPWEDESRRDSSGRSKSMVWPTIGGYGWFVFPPGLDCVEGDPLPTQADAEAAADTAAAKYWRLL